MEIDWVQLIGALGISGVIAVVVIIHAYKYGNDLLKNHKETTERVCEDHKYTIERICDSFDRALDRRDKDIQYLINEIRSGIIKPP